MTAQVNREADFMANVLKKAGMCGECPMSRQKKIMHFPKGRYNLLNFWDEFQTQTALVSIQPTNAVSVRDDCMCRFRLVRRQNACGPSSESGSRGAKRS